MNNDEKYHSVSELVKLWEMSGRTIRNYCATGKIPDAVLVGKTWKIPQNAVNPAKRKKEEDTVLDVLLGEWKSKINEGMYGHLQIDFAYNSLLPIGFHLVNNIHKKKSLCFAAN